MKSRILCALVLATALLLTAPASAEETDQAEVHLDWDAPSDGDFLYRVYRDGDLVGTTSDTDYVDTLPPTEPNTGLVVVHYRVTAEEAGDGLQAASSEDEEVVQDFFVAGSSSCTPIVLGSTPGSMPPVHAGINWACIPPLPVLPGLPVDPPESDTTWRLLNNR